jgi:hypothetical protein
MFAMPWSVFLYFLSQDTSSSSYSQTEAKREWEKQKEIANSLKKGIAQYALSNPSLIDIYNHIHRVCSHRIAATPRIPFPALTVSNVLPGTSAHLSNAYYSLSLLSSAPAIQSILYRVLDIYCHKDLFAYPSKNAHIATSKERYREWNEKLRETIIKFEREKEEERRGDGHSVSTTSSQSSPSDSVPVSLAFPPSHLMHCVPEDDLGYMILERDEMRREIVHCLKDVLVPEKKYEAQRKFDYLERVIGLMKEWYSLMGGPVTPTSLSKDSSAYSSPHTTKRQSSYVSPTSVLAPVATTAISSLNTIPLYEDESGGIKSSTFSQQSSLDDTKESPVAHVPPIRDVFHALELFIQNLSVWYTVASKSPIQETNIALERYESCLEEYMRSLRKFSTLQRAIGSSCEGRSSVTERHLTDVTLEDSEEDSKVVEDPDPFLLDPSLLLDNTCAAIHSLHTALDHEEYYWTRDPIATLYPSLFVDLQRILDYLTTLSLDIKKALLEGFSSLKEKEKELQQVVLWIAGSPSYETNMETLETEVRLLKRDIIRFQRDYEDKVHDLEKQRRKSGSTSAKAAHSSEDMRRIELQLISSQVEYQYKADQLNLLRRDLCQLCYQTFPEIALSNSSFFHLSSSVASSAAAQGISTTTNPSSALSAAPFPYPSIFSLSLLLSSHLNSSMHFLYQHAALLSHGALQYHRSLEDYLNLTLVSSSERYLTYKAVDKNREVYIKKYHITSGSSAASASQTNAAVASLTEQSFSQFEKLYLEATRLAEMSYAQRHPHGDHSNGIAHSASVVDVQSLFISSPTSPTPSVFLVFPSYPNGNLVQFLASYDAQLSLLSRVSLMKGLCSALSYFHDHLHILHCNLKLENVLISSAYRCVLSDYDISYLGDANRYNGTVHTPSKGFLDYLPPENLPPNSLPMSMASDVYCYGICLLRVLNKPLCRNRDNGLHAVGYYDREDAKNGFKELIEQILSIDPKHRPSTGDILTSAYFLKWDENNWPSSNGEPMIEEGSISRSDREEIEKLKRGGSFVKADHRSLDAERDDDRSDDSSVPISAQPSGSVIHQVFLQRQRVCTNCGLETDLSQGISCCDSASTSAPRCPHFLCVSCLNQYVHSECSMDISSRRWLRIFDKTTKEEFHVRRSAEHIVPYFTTKKKCHVEGISEILEKNPWSDLHEFNHEFDVRQIYEDHDEMMKIICPAYHTVSDLREKHLRCENMLSKTNLVKLLSPQVLYEFERSQQELLEWKLTWEYSYRVTQDRKHLLKQVLKKREAELKTQQQGRNDEEDEEEQPPESVEMVHQYIAKNIHCVRCPQCDYLIGNAWKENQDRDRNQEGDDEGVGDKEEKEAESEPDGHPDTLPLLQDSSHAPPRPPPPPPPRHPPSAPGHLLPAGAVPVPALPTVVSAAAASSPRRSSSYTSRSHLTVLSCPSCASYFCSVCLTDCGGLPHRPKSAARSRSVAAKSSSLPSEDLSVPISSLSEAYSGNDEEESLKRQKFFHSLTCPYNSYGRLWLSHSEFEKLQTDRVVSMTYDFLQIFPEEIQDQYLLHHSSPSSPAEPGAEDTATAGEIKKGMKEIEI